MKELKDIILKYSRQHPARVLEYNNIYDNIMKEVKEGYVNAQSHPDFEHLKIFKYSPSAVNDKHWNIYTLMSRGLILDTLNKKVIATPPIKFFNFGELGLSIFEDEFTVTEKIDGSMGIIFFAENKWRVSTLGSFCSEQAQWATEWLNKYINKDRLDKSSTYITEIVYPENKIVIPYDISGLFLLTIYDKKGYEYIQNYHNFMMPKVYEFNNVNQILELCKTLPYDKEGFVVQFKNKVRIKIKGDEYCRIHRLISNVSPLSLWEALFKKDNIEQSFKDLPEEFKTDYDNIKKLLLKELDYIFSALERMKKETKDMSDKEIGLSLKNTNFLVDKKYPKIKNILFSYKKSDFFEKFEDAEHPMRRKIFSLFRPKSNKLDGYSPSTITNRFNSQDN